MPVSSRVYVVLTVIQLFFATLPVAVKIALRDLSSPSVAFLRVTGAALLFLVLHATLVRERLHSRRDLGRLAVYALFGVVLNQLLYITALNWTTATAAQTLQTVGPAMTLLIALLLGRERSTPAKWMGIGVAGCGALYLVGIGVSMGSGLGNLLVLLNVTAFSIYLVISRDLVRRYHPLTVITWIFLFGSIGIAPWGIPSLLAERGALSGSTVAAMVWMILVPTVTGYYLNVWALQRVQASAVAIFVYLQPVLTALIAIPLLGERPSPRLIPAGALIFAGVAASMWAERRARSVGIPSPADQEHTEP
ncbi:MAG: DMT family transporter [Gemmatimonadota bacterium]|nr:DMT family transporter [Gemmatimonadota bacterium]